MEKVAGIKHIVSAPTLLESTSLVIAYGLDVYQTLRRPSETFDVLSDDFNHPALLATIVGLIVAIYVVDHFAKRKLLAEAWK